MDTLKLQNITELIKQIKSSALYRCMANGNFHLYAALHQFENLSTNLGYANYALTLTNRCFEKYEELGDDAKRHESFFHLRNAIISYQTCYDTILQIVFWAFHFANDVENEEDSRNVMGKCSWNDKFFLHGKFRKKLKEESYMVYQKQIAKEISNKYSPDAADFANTISEYFNNKRYILNEHANIIKHRGGFTLEHQSNVSYVKTPIEFIINKSKGTCSSIVTEDIQLVQSDWFEPLEINIPDEINLLKEQNEYIVTLANYIFKKLKFDRLSTKDIFAPEYNLPFTFKTNGTE